MIAIDTNIVVRYLTGDDAAQSQRARQLVDGSDVFVPMTVMLESEWVLRSAYAFDKARVVHALRAFAGLPTVSIEQAPLVADALDHADAGMDFADALHMGASAHCTGLATFDRRFVKSADATRSGFVYAP